MGQLHYVYMGPNSVRHEARHFFFNLSLYFLREMPSRFSAFCALSCVSEGMKMSLWPKCSCISMLLLPLPLPPTHPLSPQEKKRRMENCTKFTRTKHRHISLLPPCIGKEGAFPDICTAALYGNMSATSNRPNNQDAVRRRPKWLMIGSDDPTINTQRVQLGPYFLP